MRCNLHCEATIWRRDETVQVLAMKRRTESDPTNHGRSFQVINNHIDSKAAGRKTFLVLKTGQGEKSVLLSQGKRKHYETA
jgi:hypothetical protein